MINQILAVVLLITSGCDMQAIKNESTNKTEYSILESYEYEYREIENDVPYTIVKNALKTNATVLAFPIRGKAQGYVVMLAEAEGVPKDKALPETDFVVTQSAFTEVKAATGLSKEVEHLIATHVR